MNPFTRLHGRRVPPGLEWRILKKLPHITAVGLLIPIALSVLVRVWPTEPGIDIAKQVKTVDIFAVAAAITFLTAVLTLAIGCIVVYIMKGPAYVADPYPLQHADRPAADPPTRDEPDPR